MITCRGCGKPEHKGECITPNIDKLQARIKELEELIPTKEEAEDYYNWIKEITGCIVGFNDCVGCRLQAKLQKIIGGK